MYKKFCLLAALSVAATPAAWACPSCACGDYTLTLMGTEKSYAGRLRFALDYQNRSEYQGAGVGETLLQENRAILGASYAFSPEFSVALRVPYSAKSAETAALAREESANLGDIDIAAKYTLGSVGEITARHLWGVQAGLKLPTAAEQKNAAGTPVDIDAQPGTGAYAPSGGAWYGYFRYPVSVYTSVVAIVPGDDGYQGLDQGTALLVTATSQHALTREWTVQAGIEARFAEHNKFFGVKDADSGGSAVFVVPGIVWSPTGTWLLHVSGQLPAYLKLNGDQDERGDVRVGLAFDL